MQYFSQFQKGLQNIRPIKTQHNWKVKTLNFFFWEELFEAVNFCKPIPCTIKCQHY